VRLRSPFHGHNHFHVYRDLSRVLRRGAFDLVHVDEEPYSLVTLQVVTRAQKVDTPSLFFAWQNLDKRLPPPFGALRAKVFRQVAGGIAGNQDAADVVRRRGFDGPLAVIPQMGVDPKVFRPDREARRAVRGQMELSDSDFVVGYLGRLVPEKGVDLLLEALVDVPKAGALLMGDGPDRERLVRLAGARGLSGRARFVGAIGSLDIPRWLAALDCLVLPSRTAPGWKEQFGRALIEAMACGVPVVGSSSGEIPTVVGDAGQIFQEGDGAGLARALFALSEDVALRSDLGARGRARVLANYTQEKVVDETLVFYRRLLCAPAPLRPRMAAEMR
jgi:glycosyltransferase involved in cell wall biosynthesis